MQPTIKPTPTQTQTIPEPIFTSRWIVSPTYDLFFFIGSCMFTLVFFGLYQIAHQFKFFLHGDSILITYFIFTAIFDQPHIFQTFSRTHLDKDEFAKRKHTHTWGLLIFILTGFVAIVSGYESELIVFAAIFGSYHIIRQHYGFLRAYKGINHDTQTIDNWIDYGLFYTGMFACFFNDYTDIKGPIVIYKDLKSFFPSLPPQITELVWFIFIVFLVVFVIQQLWKLANGKAINLPKILLLIATISTHYFIFFATATPFLVAEALETVYHDIQYQGWIMHYQRRKYPHIRNVVAKWLGLALAYGLVVGVIEICGLMYRGWAMWLFVPFTMVVIYHYYVDGLIWRFSKEPELRKLLFEQKNC
ncbi:MAG: hypothetical protein NZ551_10550 [Microscillaceae bacterium]|nr:hypothetical protein [Microscillaceae bacterium]MDW8461638.1 hypothetical protein [Cytophagales bacterium]